MATRQKAPPKPKRYFIVNPGGAIHEVTKEEAAYRLRSIGYRMATSSEAKTYLSTKVQRADRPLAKPWSNEPEAADLDGPEPAE